MRNFVSYEFDDGLAVVTVNNPPVNAFSREMTEELVGVFEELKTAEFVDSGFEKTSVGVVVLQAISERRVFISGADISLFLTLKTKDDAEALVEMFHNLMDIVAGFERPVICAIEGLALGGGTEIACCCDIRIAGEKARFSLDEVKLGIIPGGGGTQRLPRLIGPGRAKYLILTGERIDAREAERIGLVEKVVPEGEALSEAKKTARTILSNGQSAVKTAKYAIDSGLKTILDEGLSIERNAAVSVDFEECIELTKAFFEKKKAKFS